MKSHQIGVMGGSGLYQMQDLKIIEELTIPTPLGPTSDAIIKGELNGDLVFFLPRHGRAHTFLPSEVPYAANIWALKSLGVDTLLSVSAVGSLKEEIEPGHIVVCDQFFDRTKGIRKDTFFGQGIVGHVSFGNPIEPELASLVAQTCAELNIPFHNKGTYVCMEGPQFSTKAESHSYRRQGFEVIGMTNLSEAKLAREAEIAYVSIALSTDYDCWHESVEQVTTEAVIAVLKNNVLKAQNIIKNMVPKVKQHKKGWPESSAALKNAIMTHNPEIKGPIKEVFKLLTAHYPHYQNIWG